jgi:epoxyqueuosine reductase
MSARSLVDELHQLAEAAGLDKIGTCSAEVFAETRAVLHERRDQGLHADMQFAYRNPDRATDPERALPGARSIVVGARSYRRAEPVAGTGAAGQARVGEYVWEAHYVELREALEQLSEHLRSRGHKTRILIDDNALVDRAAAHRAGIGWWGKNSNLLIPGKGSRFVLGSIVTDADLQPVSTPLDDACGTCRRCIDNCPTGAIVDDGVIDANLCLAWLVQAKGVFPREHRRALGNRIYGCDDCQATCPPNLLHDRREPAPDTRGQAWVQVQELLTLDDDELLERFGVWYIPGREPRYLRRNALLVLGNVAAGDDTIVRELLTRWVGSPDPIERLHALWAAAELGQHDLIDDAVGDDDPLVAEEVHHLIQERIT